MVRSTDSDSSASWFEINNSVSLDFAAVNIDQQEYQEEDMSGNNNTTLGLSQGDITLDYANSEGMKTYKRATPALKDEYNGKSKGIAAFQMQLAEHADTEGWSNKSAGDIINIPREIVDPSNRTINIIKQHTQITVKTLTTWVTNNLFNGNVTRKMQNNENMKKCLFCYNLKGVYG